MPVRTSRTTESVVERRENLPSLFGLGAAVLVVLFINLRLGPLHRPSLLYALPMLLAAHRLPPAQTVGIALLGIGCALLGVLLARPPLELWLYAFLGILGIAYLAILLSVQRRQTAQRADDAELAQQALQVFLGMVTHDLASPLTAILGHAQLLRRKLPPADPVRGSALAIERSARQMHRLVNDLHEAAAIGAGRFTVVPRAADLVAVLQQVVAQQRASAPNRRITINAPERLDGVWDAQRLGQLATNLVSNAIKYSPPDSEVRVVVGVEDDVVHLSVKDEGPGMLPEQQQELFRPFSRLARDRSIQGTGLGLYIANTIVREHGGQIALVSAPGKGSTFTVTLPRRLAPARLVD